MEMSPRMHEVKIMSVTYHPSSSKVSISVWYLSMHPNTPKVEGIKTISHPEYGYMKLM